MNITQNQVENVNNQLDPITLLNDIGYRTDTINRVGDTLRCFCPIHKETIFRNLLININKKSFKCGYTLCAGFHGDDFIDLYSKAKNISYEKSIQYWCDKLGILWEQIITEEPVLGDSQIPSSSIIPKLEVTPAEILQELENQPDNRELRSQLAELYLQTGDITKAIEHYATLGLQSISANNYLAAITYFDKILSLDAQNNHAMEMLAQAYSNIGQINSAITIWSQLVQNHLFNENYQKAVDIYSELIRYDALEVKWRSALAELYIKMERYVDAVREYKLLAEYHTQRGQLKESFDIYEIIILLTPQDLDVKKLAINTAYQLNQPERIFEYLLELLDSLLSSGNSIGAIELLDQSISELPTNILLRKKLIELLLQSGATDGVINQLNSLVQLYLENKDFLSAAETYQQLISLEPENIVLYAKLAELYEKQGFRNELLDIYSRLAKLYLSQQAIEPAITILKRALEIDPANKQTQSTLANAYIQEKSQSKATEVLFTLAKQYQMDGDLDKSCRTYEKILELNPTATQALNSLIDIHQTLGNTDQTVKYLYEIAEIYRHNNEFIPALSYIRQAARFRPKDIRIFNLQGEIYQQLGLTGRAIVSYYRASRILYEQNKLTESVQMIQQAMAVNPNTPKLREHLAKLFIRMELKKDGLMELRKLGDYYKNNKIYHKSIIYFEEARKIEPHNISILESLASLYENICDFKQASLIYYALGKAFSEKGLFNDAIKSFHKLLTFEPDNQNAMSNLAQYYLQVGAIPEAINQYYELIKIYRGQNQYADAIELCKQILHLDSNNSDIHEIMVDIYLQIGEQNDALTHLLILANIYQEDEQKSIEIYRRILKISPKMLVAYPPLADIYQKQGQIKDALSVYYDLLKISQENGFEDDIYRAYLKIIELEPRNIDNRKLLVSFYIKTGKITDALMEYDVIASIYLEKKDYQNVIKIYQAMQKLAPNNDDISRAIKQMAQLDKK